MSRSLINKYVWVLETIQRYGRISGKQLASLWQASAVSGGEPLARRTFYNYRNGIEELFGIRIGYCKSTFEYFIEGGQETGGMSEWLINSMSINGMLSDAADIADRIMFEEVPSAREHLSTIIEAMKQSRKMEISYTPFYRIKTTAGIRIEPYFLRLFKQRWYLIGYNTGERKIKTYSLDRIGSSAILEETFDMPDNMSVADFFKDSIGITTSHGEAKEIIIRTDPEQAKYMRALPLHPSQQEQVCDGYSVFRYHLCITYDLVKEILSNGDKMTVIAPPELRAMITETLHRALSAYDEK